MPFLLKARRARLNKRDRFVLSLEGRDPSVTIRTRVVTGAAMGAEKHRLESKVPTRERGVWGRAETVRAL